MIEKTGDLFTSDAPAIGHGVNTKGKMGAGIAVQFKNRFPKMYDSYRDLCATGMFRPGGVMVYSAESPVVYNIASQDLPGANARLDWLETGLRITLEDAEERNIERIALPQIGCGIGGLSLPDVLEVIKNVEANYVTEIELWTYEA